MQWSKLALAGPSIMALGACGTIGLTREPPPVVVQQTVVIPAECRLDPVEPREVVEPVLAPEVGDAAALSAARLINAQVAFLFWRDRANAAQEAYETNAGPQAACAAWARAQ